MGIYILYIVLLAFAAALGVCLAQIGLLGRSKSNFVCYGEGFSAGIFFGASLLHMLPDAIHNLWLQTSYWEYPIATLLCAAGFLLLYFIEQFTKHFLRGSKESNQVAATMTYLLLVVLCIHSFVVGLSLGLEGNSISALVIILAIFVHKASAGFVLGMSMHRSMIPGPKRALMTVFFSISTPLGLLVGMYLMVLAHFSVSGLMEGLFDALAAGTFLFMAMHFSQTTHQITTQQRVYSLLMVVLGFMMMAVLAMFL